MTYVIAFGPEEYYCCPSKILFFRRPSRHAYHPLRPRRHRHQSRMNPRHRRRPPRPLHRIRPRMTRSSSWISCSSCFVAVKKRIFVKGNK